MGLRIIAFTDIHGAYSVVEGVLAREPRFDVVILGGDLTTMGTPGEAEAALDGFREHGATLLAVAGNMDPRDLEEVFERQNVSINGRGVILEDVGIFGASASPFSPLHTPYEVSEGEIWRLAERGWSQVTRAHYRVFVPHSPPFGTKVDVVTTGKHVGSTAVRKFIEQYQPDLVLCGHIHEARGEDMIGRTKVVNCGAAGHGHYVTVDCGDTPVVTAY